MDIDHKSTAQHEVYLHLRQKILLGEFAVGERIIPNDVAKELGVSRMPVREALRQLDSEGLVDLRPNRGALVTQLSSNELFEIYAIRMALEGTAARLAAKNRTKASIAELDFNMHRLLAADENLRDWLHLHGELHDFIARMSGMPKLLAETRRFRSQLDPYLLKFYLEIYSTPEMPGSEHEALIQAIKEGTPDEAEVAMRQHILSSAEGVVAHYGAQPKDIDAFRHEPI
ncbi:MAG: GntR family transcriptional regulator [Rhizobiaceae bacterium]|nr:GntR family transcriptional regulator [Rhizobiaceae bacterium]